MCGILGIIDHKLNKEALKKCRDTLTHRGPDGAGIWINKDNTIALAHRRLSIIDLSHLGDQPMSNHDKTIWIIFNGEIYNYQEIKKELKVKGYSFKSNSDTEVIIKAYEAWGLNCVHKFRGMWAFALWDEKKEKLLLCRDRVGVKPLYYYRKNNVFICASELKAIIAYPKFYKQIDKKSLALYFKFGYIPAPYTIFKNTYKVIPGTWLEVDKDITQLQKKSYWNIKDYYLKGVKLQQSGYWDKKNEQVIVDELEHILTESFNLRMVADVPVGIFLSGGIDSSALVAILAKNHHHLKTFTIGFNVDTSFNEAPYAKKIAEYFGTEHTEHYFTPTEMIQIIPKIPLYFDEPFGDSSALPTYLVSTIARKKVKVSLSADGGDELFAGYPHLFYLEKINKFFNRTKFFNTQHLINYIAKNSLLLHQTEKILKNLLPCQNIKKKLQKIAYIAQQPHLEKQFEILQSEFIPEEINKLGLPPSYEISIYQDILDDLLDPLAKLLIIDFKSYLVDDILVKVDRVTMGASIEGREPFLDNKIIEYVAQMPSNWKQQNNQTKYILKKILYKYLPKKFIERPKHGFSIPLEHFTYKKALSSLINEHLNQDAVNKLGILNFEYIDDIASQWRKGTINFTRLWLLLVFQLWGEAYL